jgi:hypothetical protein
MESSTCYSNFSGGRAGPAADLRATVYRLSVDYCGYKFSLFMGKRLSSALSDVRCARVIKLTSVNNVIVF